MKEAQTTQEALNTALNDAQAWKVAALAVNAERDALAAQVEILRDELEYFVEGDFKFNEGSEYLADDIIEVLEKIPQQHLAEIRAEAGKQAIYALFEAGNCQQYENGAGDGYIECGDALKFAERYSEQIRQGGEK